MSRNLGRYRGGREAQERERRGAVFAGVMSDGAMLLRMHGTLFTNPIFTVPIFTVPVFDATSFLATGIDAAIFGGPIRNA